MRYFIGVDPSINHTGWALIQVNPKQHGDAAFSLLGSGVFKHEASEGDGRVGDAYRELYYALEDVVIRACPGVVAIIEKPHYETTRKSKHIFQLVQAAGACVSAVVAHGIPYAFITANQWKRELPKWKIKWRVEQLFPKKKGKWAREDEYEACGLALWGNARRGEYEVWGGDA